MIISGFITLGPDGKPYYSFARMIPFYTTRERAAEAAAALGTSEAALTPAPARLEILKISDKATDGRTP